VRGALEREGKLMSRIAILGATSQIASDLILGWACRHDISIDLFARRVGALSSWLTDRGIAEKFRIFNFSDFGAGEIKYDAVINFVGVGDPARAKEMGSSVLEITRLYDSMALAYLDRFPNCRYLFLSSGAVYGPTFLEPAGRDSTSRITINDLSPQEFYAVAKLYAEVGHRARADRTIFDIRVFNIFSRTQDLNARFFITDIVRAIRDGSLLKVSSDEMVRDFLHPSDFLRLIEALLMADPANTPVDCYSRSPVDKFRLLESMSEWFGLRWETGSASNIVNATGSKPNYFSTNTRAADFGYQPQFTSLEGLRMEINAILA